MKVPTFLRGWTASGVNSLFTRIPDVAGDSEEAQQPIPLESEAAVPPKMQTRRGGSSAGRSDPPETPDLTRRSSSKTPSEEATPLDPELKSVTKHFLKKQKPQRLQAECKQRGIPFEQDTDLVDALIAFRDLKTQKRKQGEQSRKRRSSNPAQGGHTGGSIADQSGAGDAGAGAGALAKGD